MADGATLILAALAAELSPVRRRLALRREDDDSPGASRGLVWRGSPLDREVIAAATGVGRERAAEAARQLIERYRPDRMLIVGTAGAVDPALRAGEVIIPARVIDAVTGQQLSPTLAGDSAGTLYTTAGLVESPAQKARLRRELDVEAIDMETAAMADVCEKQGVAWLCVRAILDTADDCLPAALLNLTRPDGRANIAAAGLYAVARPWRVPLLLRLAGRTHRGMAAVAEQLVTLL